MEGYEQSAVDLWQHSLAVAFGSRIIAQRKFPALSDDAFTAGLLHDTGKLALDPYILEHKEALQKFISNGCKSFLHTEKELLGLDHSEIASEICKKRKRKFEYPKFSLMEPETRNFSILSSRS